MSELALREELIDSCRQLNALGLNQGTSGNISVRLGAGLLITPSGVPYERLRPEHLVTLAMDGTTRDSLPPSSEWRFHADILQQRPDVTAVVHAHPPFCTALAICEMEIPAVHYMIAAAGGNSIRCARYETFGTQELSDAILEALEDRSACLMANHGMIATGSSLERAMWLATEVEALARQYQLALQVGKPRVLPDDEIERVLEKFRGYGLRTPES